MISAVAVVLLGSLASGCCDHDALDYQPLELGDWRVSTPEEQGMDRELLDDLYCAAQRQDTLYGLLVVKNGHLVAEQYWGEGSVEQEPLLQSVSKSYFSALVGTAIDQGCLSSVDLAFLDLFPELREDVTDPRKEEITLRLLLQMRSGLPWEESDPALWDDLQAGDHLRLFAEYPLVADPGAEVHYSNLSPYLLGAAVSRACDVDLVEFAQEHLLPAIDSEMDTWYQDAYGYYYPLVHARARDMAKLGLTYLDEGMYEGERVLSEQWVEDSLRVYSGHAWDIRVGRNFRDFGYGYQWWSARAGDHFVSFAWGHGGQLIVLHEDLDMIVVTTADPFWQQHDGESWRHESGIMKMVGNYFDSLPPP